MKRVVVVGGGPAGMMAAISTKMHYDDFEVVLLEKNEELGRKMKLTGGGRCNITARVSDLEVINNVPKNGKFLYSSLSNFNTIDIINFFEENGCNLKEEDHYRMFPVSNKALDIVLTLEKVMKKLGVVISYNTVVTSIDEKNVYSENKKFSYDYIILATGGITLPNTGSNGEGYEFAKRFGHTITELLPAEVPLVSNDEFIHSKVLQGLSFKDVCVSIYKNKKIKKQITHDLLITHFGISGPAALRASFEVINILKEEKEVYLEIDFLPKYNIKDLLDNDLEEIIKENQIPKKLVSYLSIDTKNETEILEKLKAFPINVYTTRGFKSAFVTNGGIYLKEVNPQTMKSKINDRISFCGEILDTNAYTGGFNITQALVTGYTAGKYVY